MYGPSPHLSWDELGCNDGTPYPQEWRNERALILAEAFEMVRAYFGGLPIRISSAYRTPSWNRMVGGAEQSQHVQGRALDMFPPRVWTTKEFHGGILVLTRRRGVINGIGRYRTFVHIDIRPGEFALWTGDRLTPEWVDYA